MGILINVIKGWILQVKTNEVDHIKPVKRINQKISLCSKRTYFTIFIIHFILHSLLSCFSILGSMRLKAKGSARIDTKNSIVRGSLKLITAKKPHKILADASEKAQIACE